jgi:hypothetical protein
MSDPTYVSQAARDAQRAGYGSPTYWAYVDRCAAERFAYFVRRGDVAKAQSMLTSSLREVLSSYRI